MFKEKVAAYDVQMAMNDALLEICQFHDWNFLIDRFDIQMWPAYSTGTISLNQGSTLVTGTGTTWDPTWFNRKMMPGGLISSGASNAAAGSGNDKEVAFFSSPTSATLRYPWPYASITNGGYFVYQDEYPVPMQNGRDIAIMNKIMSWRVKKMDRYSLEDRTIWGWQTSGSQMRFYTDGGADVQPTSPTYNWARLKFWPIPNVSQDLILYFFKTPTNMVADTDTTVLPNEFEELLVRLTLYRLRKRIGSPGWMDDYTYAMKMLVQFREKQNTQASYDYSINFAKVPYLDSYTNDQAWGGVWPGRLNG